jgi:hypothetical protein
MHSFEADFDHDLSSGSEPFTLSACIIMNLFSAYILRWTPKSSLVYLHFKIGQVNVNPVPIKIHYFVIILVEIWSFL